MIWFAVGLAAAALSADPPYIRSLSNTVGPGGVAACLHWSAGKVELRQNVLGSPDVPGTLEFDAVTRALSHWQAEFDRCGNLTLVEGPHTQSRTVGFRLGATDGRYDCTHHHQL